MIISMKPRFIVEQKITAFVNRYAVFAADEQAKKEKMVAFVEQKRLALKEKVSFFSDETKSELIFTFRAEKVLDVHGRYLVEDGGGNYIGAFKKEFAKSLLNSTWNILDNDSKAVLTVSESNQILAVARRFVGFIPIVGELFDIVLAFFRYHFTLTMPGTKQEVGKYQKTTLFRDHYLLSLDDDVHAAHDWRVLVAMAVALDALQSR